MNRLLRVIPVALAITLAIAGSAFAQGQGNGTLTGTVVDNVGVVPGATVSATQVTTNVVRSTTSNDQGVFRIVSLQPGRYTVKVEMDGFKPVMIAEFALLGGELRELGRVTLSAGGISEAVTITAEVTPVQTASSQLTKNITGDTLVSVQVKGRDIFGMMKILPGVVDTTANRDFAQWNSGRGLSINGGNSLNKNTTIDGVPVGEEGGDGTTYITPNLDAIGEVNVVTSGYTAENGRQSSGLVSITTKSGTNQFRGSGWYSARRDEWNKNAYLRILNKQVKSPFEVNITGYSFGGPIIIPGVGDSRTSQRKVYFFVSQEFVADIRPTTTSRSNLPTALERTGNFSDTRVTNGNIQQIIDPNTGVQFPGNIIPANRINPMGQSMLNLLPLPNGILNLQAGQAYTSNDARDQTPEHSRKNFVMRIDTVLNQSARFSVKTLFDRDDSVTFNRVAPGIGSINNMFPGQLISGAYTQVLGASMVNELTLGYAFNHYGFKIGTGKLNPADYKEFWRENVGVDPPRLAPFGPYGEPHLGSVFLDQYPYLPEMNFAGGDREGFINYRPSGNGGPLPRWNANSRYTLQDDLSVTKGRHNLKFGFFTERDSKTEPGSVGYAGQFNFGHSTDNPLSTGNGYANALLGVYTTYTELDKRLDRENAHWQSDAYAQDSWRITSRMTIDYGLRVTHAGAVYETRNQNSAFDPSLWSAAQAPLLYRPACKTGVAGNVACSSANRAAIDPRFPGVYLAQAYAGNSIPGTGQFTNGQFTGGLPGKKAGWYYDMPALSLAPRIGMAWDVFGDGTTAIRASGGVFYNFINRAQYQFNGGALISNSQVVRNATLDDITNFAQVGAQFAQNPQTVGLPDGFPLTLYGNQLPVGKLQPEKNYQANVAFQRDLGFNTVAEVAYVGNFGRHFWRAKQTNTIPINAYANPANLFNNEPIAADFLRRDYPGVGQINYLTTDDDVLNYNAMQVSVQRRLTKGLQMGAAYTLSKAMGVKGWDYVTEELYGKQGLRDRYYGPPSATQEQDRRHSLVVNYSYQLPNPLPNVPVVKYLFANWEASGVTQFLTGNAIDPVCNTNQSGVLNTNPSLTGVATRCELTGQDINAFTPDPNAVFADQVHFNIGAFRRPKPVNGIGNLGDAPIGVLRHPSWSNWDLTLARRIPVNIGRGGSVRIQWQLYNMWNQVQFTTMDATARFDANGNNVLPNTGKYTQTTNPLNMGLTLRFDY